MADERLVARKHKCHIGRIKVAELQAACRSHGDEVHELNAQSLTKVREHLLPCARFPYVAYCWAAQRPDWTTSGESTPPREEEADLSEECKTAIREARACRELPHREQRPSPASRRARRARS